MAESTNWLASVMASAAAALPCFGGRRQRAAARDYDWVDSAVGPVTVRRDGQLGRSEAAETEIGRLTLALVKREQRIEALEKHIRQQLADYRKVLWDRNVQKGMAEVWEERCRRKERELAGLKLDMKAMEDRIAMVLEEVAGLRGQQEELEELLGQEEERIRGREGNIGVEDVVVERGAQEEEPDYIEMEFEEAEEGEEEEEELVLNYLSAEE
jgi:chromosome segregation ATPase